MRSLPASKLLVYFLLFAAFFMGEWSVAAKPKSSPGAVRRPAVAKKAAVPDTPAIRDLRKAANSGDLSAVAHLHKMGVPYRKPWTPFRLSAWPQPDFTSSFPRSPYVRGISVGLSVTQDTEVFGLQVAPLPMVVRGAGLQIGASSHADQFYGVQIGLLSASDRRFGGIQISAMNNTDGFSERSSGVQLGLINGGEVVRGVQMGAGNAGRDMRGLQIGAVNLSRVRMSGFQIGLYNSSRNLKGVQIGLLNRVAGRRFLGGYLPVVNAGW